MNKSRGQMHRFVVVVLTLFSMMAVLPLATSGQGNSETAHLCQDGGYLDVTDADGNSFKNTGQCVSYVARGGTVVQVVESYVTMSVGAVYGHARVSATVYGGGLDPGSNVSLSATPAGDNVFLDLGPPVDGDGNFSYSSTFTGWRCDTDYPLRATTNGGAEIFGVFRFPCPSS